MRRLLADTTPLRSPDFPDELRGRLQGVFIVAVAVLAAPALISYRGPAPRADVPPQ